MNIWKFQSKVYTVFVDSNQFKTFKSWCFPFYTAQTSYQGSVDRIKMVLKSSDISALPVPNAQCPRTDDATAQVHHFFQEAQCSTSAGFLRPSIWIPLKISKAGAIQAQAALPVTDPDLDDYHFTFCVFLHYFCILLEKGVMLASPL